MIDLSGKRIALVGGAGFIGHNLALELSRRGAHVEIVDGLEVNNLLHYIAVPPGTANRDLYLKILQQRLDLLREEGIPLHVQDARDYHALSSTLNEIEPELVVHLAAIAHATRSNKDPMSTFGHSTRTLENALDWSRGRAEQFVYMSSSMVYGNFLTPEVAEDHPTEPIGIYGALKLGGELIVKAYEQVFGLPYTIIRPSALYGPRCVSRRVGQAFIESALAGAKLRVDGDGEEKLDFSWVGDVVDGLVRTMFNPAARNETFNITAGKSRSINDLIAVVREYFPEVDVEYVERDALRPYRGTLSVDKARDKIGYAPNTRLEDGVREYVQWYRDLVSDGVGALAGSAPR